MQMPHSGPTPQRADVCPLVALDLIGYGGSEGRVRRSASRIFCEIDRTSAGLPSSCSGAITMADSTEVTTGTGVAWRFRPITPIVINPGQYALGVRRVVDPQACTLPAFDPSWHSRTITVPSPPALRTACKSRLAGYRQFDFCAGAVAATEAKTRSDFFCPFSHSRESPVSLAAGLHHFRIDSTAVVTHNDAQLIRKILDLDRNVLGAGVTKGVEQRLPANPVDLVAQQRVERPPPPFYDYSKTDFLAVLPMCGTFLLHRCERFFQIQRLAIRRTQA